MSKYIDAEKLIAEIERFSAIEYGGNTFGDDVANGALDYVLEEIIPSLQQEQQEVNLEEEMRKELRLHYNDDQDVYWWNYLKNSFRHFYELGLKAK